MRILITNDDGIEAPGLHAAGAHRQRNYQGRVGRGA